MPLEDPTQPPNLTTTTSNEADPGSVKTYPSTTCFPANPTQLDRQQLEEAYLNLRHNYKGLQISRGQFVAQNRRYQQKLQEHIQQQENLILQLSQKDLDKNKLQKTVNDLKALTEQQKQLVAEVQGEFNAVKSDRGNIIDKFNRIMRAVYRLLNQDVGYPSPRKVMESPEDWADDTVANVQKNLLDR